jgi:hypothetical protein
MVPRWPATGGGKRKTVVENQKVQEQIAATGPRFHDMKTTLRRFSKVMLWTWAVNLSAQSKDHITPPNRIERRIKDALVCWYCKLVPGFPCGAPGLESPATRNRPNLTTNVPIDVFPSMDEPGEEEESIYIHWL